MIIYNKMITEGELNEKNICVVVSMLIFVDLH